MEHSTRLLFPAARWKEPGARGFGIACTDPKQASSRSLRRVAAVSARVECSTRAGMRKSGFRLREVGAVFTALGIESEPCNHDPMNTPATQEFMLLFRNTQLERRLAADEMTQAMQRLNVWLERWSVSGNIKAGQPLSYDGKTISGAKQRTVADGPFAESKEAVGGYVLVQAANFDEAMEIAGQWPLLDYECVVEVRPVRVQCPTMEEVGMELYPVNG